ncbi:MAG: nicotinate-nucleotide adenylyltransferase [Chloroflexota bacterium]|nr:nicotinate-nucleotide adenylyltransferase [Chloroflexota bacterium]
MALLGVLGGTYDPPHHGHLAAAEEARYRLGLDRVLWVPVGDPPHKRHRAITPAAHRIAMVRAAVADNRAFEVSDVELRRAGPSYTVDTLDQLRVERSLDSLVFLMGSDEFSVLSTWYQAERLPELAHLGVLIRSGARLNVERTERELPGVQGRYTLVPVPSLPISSSSLRERVREGLPIRYLVPEPVREYIEMHRLYER